MQSLFIYDLEGKLRQKQPQAGQVSQALPYEFRALEAVLISVTTGLEEEFNGVRDPVVRVLRALEEDIDRDKLRHLLIYSKKLGTFEQKARLVRDAIDDLLEADDDLAAMYLTERAKGKQRDENDHQEVEMLLESYHKVCDEIVQASGNLVTGIRNTEEVYAPVHPLKQTRSNLKQGQSNSRRQPQFTHAPRFKIQHWHPRPRHRNSFLRPLRHEPEELHRRIRLRLRRRLSHLFRPDRDRLRIWPRQAPQAPARSDVG